MKYIIPVLIAALIIFCLIKKLPAYDLFIEGAKGAIPLCVSLFPYIAAIAILAELMSASGASSIIAEFLSPVLGFFGIPEGLFELILFRPFSGSGSFAIIENVFKKFGVDSYEGRVAAVIAGSSETVFYLLAVYFSANGIKKYNKAVLITLLSTFLGVVLSCLICKVL